MADRGGWHRWLAQAAGTDGSDNTEAASQRKKNAEEFGGVKAASHGPYILVDGRALMAHGKRQAGLWKRKESRKRK